MFIKTLFRGWSVDISAKQKRVGQNHLSTVLNFKNLKDPIAAVHAFDFIERIRREVRITPSGKAVYFNDKAFASFIEICNLAEKLLPQRNLVLRSDVDFGCKVALGRLYEESEPSKDFEAFMVSVERVISEGIKIYRFYTTLDGLIFDGVSQFRIGDLTIQRPDRMVLESCDATDLSKASTWREMKRSLWISGEVEGSVDYAENQFFNLVRATCGLLAVSFTTVLERGALSVRLQPVMVGRSRPTSANWFSFELKSKVLRSTVNMEALQGLTFNAEQAEGLSSCNWFNELIRIVNLPSFNEMEGVVRRGIYWFFDAQSDSALEMKLVKLWSCIECVFSIKEHGPNNKTTDKIRKGLTAVLTYGRFKFSPPDKLEELDREINKLYGLRCDAVHNAYHDHVEWHHVIMVSKWAAWLLIEVTMIISGGYDTRRKLKDEVDRMHRLRSIDCREDSDKRNM